MRCFFGEQKMKFNKKVFILIILCSAGLALPSLSDSDLPELPTTDITINELQTEEKDIQTIEEKIKKETQEVFGEENSNKIAEEETNQQNSQEQIEITSEDKEEVKTETKQEKVDPVRIEVSSQRIPAGTSFDVKLNNSINSVSAEIGDQFNTSLVNDIIINDNVVLPSGSVIRGTIGKVKKSGLCFQEARIMLVFDHVVTPIGKQIPIYAYVSNNNNVNYAGYFVGGTSYGQEAKKDLQKSKDMIVNSTNWGIETGKKYLSGVPTVITVPVGAIGGTLGGSGYFVGKSIYNIFNKGANVYIDKNATLTITLSRDLDVPVN